MYFQRLQITNQPLLLVTDGIECNVVRNEPITLSRSGREDDTHVQRDDFRVDCSRPIDRGLLFTRRARYKTLTATSYTTAVESITNFDDDYFMSQRHELSKVFRTPPSSRPERPLQHAIPSPFAAVVRKDCRTASYARRRQFI